MGNQTSEAQRDAAGSPGEAFDVLVVDDDAATRAVLCAAVTQLGHRCRTAANGEQALLEHRKRRADIIVTDWTMPGLDGTSLCRQVRALDRGTYTYLLITSGLATKGDFVESVRAGADDYLPKPVDLEDLQACLIAAGRMVRAYRDLAERNVGLRRDSQAFFRAARVDALTGVDNRRRLDEDLAALQGEVSRYGRRASVAMCDLDSFKRYNDFYGHQAGDEALRRVAHAIRSCLRDGDRVYRYGGEEFLVTLPEQDASHASAAMERVRGAVEDLGIVHAPATKHPKLTVSIGLATIAAQAAQSVSDAVSNADRALYRAKGEGGNIVVVEGDGEMNDTLPTRRSPSRADA